MGKGEQLETVQVFARASEKLMSKGHLIIYQKPSVKCVMKTNSLLTTFLYSYRNSTTEDSLYLLRSRESFLMGKLATGGNMKIDLIKLFFPESLRTDLEQFPWFSLQWFGFSRNL